MALLIKAGHNSGLIRLAVMQPYFLPYFGYWQLLAAADRFVIYDDVQYIKGGWINRNRIKLNGKPAYISLKLVKASPNKRICDLDLAPGVSWRERLVKTIEQAYARAPHLAETMPLVRSVVNYPETSLAGYLLNSIMQVRKHLAIDTAIVPSSRNYGNSCLTGQARVLDICRRESASCYINSEGGRALYSATDFRETGIALSFLTLRPMEYAQGNSPFVPQLSIVDVLMWLGLDNARKRLSNCDIQSAK
jgi:hypothetical protein